MSSSVVGSEAELREIIKAPPGTVTAKILSGPLRSSPREFLAAARFALMTVVSAGGERRIFAAGGSPGFVEQDAAERDVIVPAPADLESTAAFGGLLLMVPGVRHTFRVNGPVRHDDGVLRLSPEESYAHCAKALIRSELWSGTTQSEVDQTAVGEGGLDDLTRAFIGASPFVAIGTSGVSDGADVSPRGDAAGFVQVLPGGRLFIPERPGNRIADTLRNIIANPRVALLFVVPGDERTLEVIGDAEVSTDAALRAASAVAGKEPKLGIIVSVQSAALTHSPALAAGEVWDQAAHADESTLPTIGALVTDPNQTGSFAKRALTGLTDRAVTIDYKRNLY